MGPVLGWLDVVGSAGAGGGVAGSAGAAGGAAAAAGGGDVGAPCPECPSKYGCHAGSTELGSFWYACHISSTNHWLAPKLLSSVDTGECEVSGSDTS